MAVLGFYVDGDCYNVTLPLSVGFSTPCVGFSTPMNANGEARVKLMRMIRVSIGIRPSRGRKVYM